MATVEIIQISREDFHNANHPLREKSEEVITFDSSFQKSVDDLLDTFYHWKIAVGLSAPQIGIKQRIAVVNLSKDKPENTLVIVNPRINSLSGKKDVKKESCLSIPKVRGDVERRHKLSLDYQDRYGNQKTLSADGFFARVILHEIDHMDGILFLDRMAADSTLEDVDFNWE